MAQSSEHEMIEGATPETVQQLSTTELIREIASKATLLVKKEVELARNEFKNDLNAELAVLKGLAVAAVAGLVTLNLLLVAAVFALAQVLPGWLAALCVAAVTLLIAIVAGLVAWGKHVGSPLGRTRKTLKEDVQWAKEELA